MSDNIILIDYCADRKPQVGQQVAQSLGWDFVDTDVEITAVAGKSIPDAFAELGEVGFRKIERKVLKHACEHVRTVIAIGRDAILDIKNRELIVSSGMVVCLEDSETTIQRVSGFANWTVHTDSLSVPEACQEILRGWHYWKRQHIRESTADSEDALLHHVITATNSYPIHVGWGIFDQLGELVQQAGVDGRIYLISDSTVYPLYGARVEASLQDKGFETSSFVVPAGETSKSLETAISVYSWLIDHRVERGDTIFALGGGMTGDLAGFVAATFLRGLSVVQLPTTLLAMVDASIGGKTAVNHPQAKNVIGAFHQPRMVLSDVQTLESLSHRELTSGWAELIKHALILDADGIELIEANALDLQRLDPEVTTQAIKRSTSIKARVVSEDEKESGKRTLLNYGHTIAHGIETATNYERFLHGEAVAIGMVGAAGISSAMGLLSQEEVERQDNLLKQFGLPVSCYGIDQLAITKAMEMDKKVLGKKIRWVLLDTLGHAVIRNDVPSKIVPNILRTLLKD